jgi:hypothetical protein
MKRFKRIDLGAKMTSFFHICYYVNDAKMTPCCGVILCFYCKMLEFLAEIICVLELVYALKWEKEWKVFNVTESMD